MITKLTLTIDKDVIGKAKKHASLQGRSLSNIVETYLKVITSDEKLAKSDYTPRIKALKGSFKAPAGFDYKEELRKGLADKYL
jgi:hypothetical protein